MNLPVGYRPIMHFARWKDGRKATGVIETKCGKPIDYSKGETGRWHLKYVTCPTCLKLSGQPPRGFQ